VKDNATLALLVVGGLLLFGGTTAVAALPSRKEDPVQDGLQLVNRARTGERWASVFESIGASPTLAAGLSRWVGIESGGNPRAVSRLDERGLLQALPTTRKAFFNDAEWAELGDPATTDQRHAELAMKEYAWLLGQAKRYAKNVPDGDDGGSLFYAKLYHQRPKDMTDVKLSGSGAAANALLAAAWGAKAPNSDHRRKAAAVVGWGNPDGAVYG
jgi:hypothetical protein